MAVATKTLLQKCAILKSTNIFNYTTKSVDGVFCGEDYSITKGGCTTRHSPCQSIQNIRAKASPRSTTGGARRDKQVCEKGNDSLLRLQPPGSFSLVFPSREKVTKGNPAKSETPSGAFEKNK